MNSQNRICLTLLGLVFLMFSPAGAQKEQVLPKSRLMALSFSIQPLGAAHSARVPSIYKSPKRPGHYTAVLSPAVKGPMSNGKPQMEDL